MKNLMWCVCINRYCDVRNFIHVVIDKLCHSLNIAVCSGNSECSIIHEVLLHINSEKQYSLFVLCCRCKLLIVCLFQNIIERNRICL